MKPWETKAHAIIAAQCLASYRRANVKRDGTLRRAHVPYHVPPIAGELVECLRSRDELRAKALFIRLAILGDSA